MIVSKKNLNIKHSVNIFKRKEIKYFRSAITSKLCATVNNKALNTRKHYCKTKKCSTNYKSNK